MWPLAALLEEAPIIFTQPHIKHAAFFLPAKIQLDITRQHFPTEDVFLSALVGFHTLISFSGAYLCKQALPCPASSCVTDMEQLCPPVLHARGSVLLVWAGQPCQGENMAFSYVVPFGECILGTQACAAGSVLETALSWWAARSALDASAPQHSFCIPGVWF